MHIDRARLDVDVGAPYRVQQFLTREHPARVLHEVLQQPELGRPKVDWSAVALHAVCRENVFWETLEQLKEAGASSMLVLPVEKMLA